MPFDGIRASRQSGEARGGATGASGGCKFTTKTGVTLLAATMLVFGFVNHMNMAAHQSKGPSYSSTATRLREYAEQATRASGTVPASKRATQEPQEQVTAPSEQPKQSLRPAKPEPIIGSDIDLEAIMERTKAKMKEEQEVLEREGPEGRRRREEQEAAREQDQARKREEEEEARRKAEQEEEARKREEEGARRREEEAQKQREDQERKKAQDEEEAAKHKTEEELLAESIARAEEAFYDLGSVSTIAPPILMPSKVSQRLPFTGPAQLHRPQEEVKIEKILFFMSTIDRGQRIGHWGGDKLQTILVIMETLQALCERGFDVTMWVIAAWKASDEHKAISDALYCKRIDRPITVKYWDHFPADIGGDLAHKHRLALKEAIDDYDFFMSGEDDVLITPFMVDAFFNASYRLAGAEEPNNYFPGFARKEHDKKRKDVWSLWETDAADYETKYIPGAGYFASVYGNRHQAMWMGTREQLYHFDTRCEGGFFNIEPGSWVEFWSGALQLWDHCKGLQKVIPVDMFRDFTVWHMTDTKLYVRGKGVTPVEAIVSKLERQQKELEATKQQPLDSRDGTLQAVA